MKRLIILLEEIEDTCRSRLSIMYKCFDDKFNFNFPQLVFHKSSHVVENVRFAKDAIFVRLIAR